MTNSDPAPSSIRDDSICEPSLNPNKSSGDIVELKPCRKCGVLDFELWDGRGTQAYLICNECGQEEGVQVVDLFDQDERPAWDDKLLCYPPHAVKRANEHLVEEWNTRTPDPESAAEIERLRLELNDARICISGLNKDWNKEHAGRLTAESAVAAAWGEAIKCVPTNWLDNLLTGPDAPRGPLGNPDVERLLLGIINRMKARASAIRAAGAEKTAESGDSAPTRERD